MDAPRGKNLWLWLLGAAVVVVLLVGLASRQPAPEVTVVRAARENLNVMIASNGKVEPVQPHALRAQLATFVEAVHAVEGQAVKRGQPLLTLAAADARAELARAREALLTAEDDLRAARAGGRATELAQLESDLRKAEADLARLRRERDALERLLTRQAATQDELDRSNQALARAEAEWQRLQNKKEEMARLARLDLERASLAVERGRNEIRSLEAKVQSAEVTAPVDGTLYALPVLKGQYVQVGDLLAEVADLRRVRVRAFVDEPDLGWLEPNQVVEIAWDALPARLWTGRTEMIPKTVVPRGTRSVGEVLCSVENEKIELLPNVNVNVHIRVRERTGVLVVPRGAVRGEGARRYVFVVDGGVLRQREVKLGIAGAAKQEILEGLAEGDRVVLPGDVELRDGLEVRVLEQK
jgi:HlyD family secretion protein